MEINKDLENFLRNRKSTPFCKFRYLADMPAILQLQFQNRKGEIKASTQFALTNHLYKIAALKQQEVFVVGRDENCDFRPFHDETTMKVIQKIAKTLYHNKNVPVSEVKVPNPGEIVEFYDDEDPGMLLYTYVAHDYKVKHVAKAFEVKDIAVVTDDLYNKNYKFVPRFCVIIQRNGDDFCIYVHQNIIAQTIFRLG